MKTRYIALILVLLLMVLSSGNTSAQEKVTVNTGVDLYSRYVWRGLDIASTPSIQPTLSADYCGFELGSWGAYTLSNQQSESDEIDFWLSYGRGLENGFSFTVIATDYYFPNAGIRLFNFNNYDAVTSDSTPDPGAHTIELGATVTGPNSFPVGLSGYVNVYNDAGNNTYFQIDYPLSLEQADLNFFCGFAGGSKDNPGYYGTANLNAINMGVSAVREIKMNDTFSIPLTVSLIVNPQAEISYLLVGMSF
ncbi:MAG TPA: TorF family putative porin [candidate division Zixibacteria bacterium]|nr:TorF family putative porin [candidate division Zixibacteria bacterium]